MECQGFRSRRFQPTSRYLHALIISQRIRWFNRVHFEGCTGTGIADFDRALCKARWNGRNTRTNSQHEVLFGHTCQWRMCHLAVCLFRTQESVKISA